MPEDERSFLLERLQLVRHATYSLKQRSDLFNEQFKPRFVTKYQVKKLFQEYLKYDIIVLVTIIRKEAYSTYPVKPIFKKDSLLLDWRAFMIHIRHI